ncbi:MAG: sulfatase-like hydrolase/transferase [Vicinamibacteria bacterium]
MEQLKSLYDAEIAYVDSHLGRFFDELRAREMYDSSLVIVTADHGEAFYEHGYGEHARPWWDQGPGLYDEIVHVPLLVKWPNASDASEVETVVSQTDIFPTFLEAAGLRHEGPWSVSLRRGGSGRALSEFIASPARGESTLEVALREATLKYWASYRAGSVDELYKSPAVTEVLYDLEADPSESRNLASSGHESIDAYRETLRRYLDTALETRGESPDEGVTLDRELLEKLKSLGYMVR